MARLKSRSEVEGFVKRSLGAPVLCVELSDAHFEDAVEDAELWLASYVGQIRQYAIQLVSGQSEYDVPSDCVGVVDVAWPEASHDYSLLLDPSGFYEGSILPRAEYGSQGGGGFNSGLYQFIQHTEMTRRTLSADGDYTWDPERRKLIIRPSNSAGMAIVWYASETVNYESLLPQQYRMLRRYAVARASYTLGNIRSKFSQVPTAGGSTTLNGSELIANAQLEFTELQEEMRNIVPPPAFFTG